MFIKTQYLHRSKPIPIEDFTHKIFLLTETFYPPVIGGQQLFTSKLAEQLSEKGFEVSVITRKIIPNSESIENIGKVLVKRISPEGVLKGKGWKALLPILIFIIKIFFILLRNVNNYNILIVVSFKVLPIPALIIKSIFHKDCIITVVSPSEILEGILSNESLKKMNINRTSIVVRLIKMIRDPLLKKADRFVVNSSAMKEILVDSGINKNNIQTIPIGLDTKKFSPVTYNEKIEIRKRLFLPEDKTIFCFSGRIVLTKGVMFLIRTWKEISLKYGNLHLLFIGGGKNSFDDCEIELRQYIEDNNLKENVSITSFVNNVEEYLKASDVFVFPSEYEGFGLSIIEALACELPAIVTKVGVATELIQNYKNGISINVNNQQEMLNAMEWMLKNRELWNEMGKNARESIKPYTNEAETNMYIKLFDDIHQTNTI